ncbi:hypothetical protein AVU42_gp045 [Prochlorococcus phage P-TIM68]|uniref:Uncharacterized protein n=1 Tax=Prochlorococcus phage P-TIM68 TaxID=1542477 RepID=A0A0K0KVP9_9CAUD|nr:hypothetical protein AVU42_gp045 [Prochlorococcus phage P-TIM68]AIR93418.1 hypothetical protein [Prochlorococcus phage P-TIM68]
MKQINLPMKRSFLEFMSLCEAVYDKDVMGRSQIRKTGEGGRIQPKRKQTEPEKRRMKAVGGGKMAPAKTYKDRKDIGQPNVKRSPAGRQQQPTKERGTAGLSPREQQRKAAMERRAAKKGVKTKTADELLAKKAKAKVDPNYKPQKASGMTRAERMSVVRKGETKLRNIMKGQETDKYKKETGQNPDKKGKMKIMGRVHQRMST